MAEELVLYIHDHIGKGMIYTWSYREGDGM